jgi:hypothetical protein
MNIMVFSIKNLKKNNIIIYKNSNDLNLGKNYIFQSKLSFYYLFIIFMKNNIFYQKHIFYYEKISLFVNQF